MKKIALFALAALCVSAAQAITASWSATENIAGTSQSLFDGSVTSFSIAAKITLNDPSFGSDQTILSVGGLTLRAYSNKNGFGANHVNNWSPNAPATNNGTSIVVLTFAKAEGSDNVTAKFFLNGTEQGWQGKADPTFTLTADSSVTFNANGDWTIGEAAIYDGVLDAGQIATLVANGSATLPTVPEPTALALLALGVAGLALKRKVA